MSETVTPWEFSVEGESGSEANEHGGAGPRWGRDRSRCEGYAAAIYPRLQAKDCPGGRRVSDPRRRRGAPAPGGALLVAPDDLAGGAGAWGSGRIESEEARPGATDPRSARQADRRVGTRERALAETRGAG